MDPGKGWLMFASRRR